MVSEIHIKSRANQTTYFHAFNTSLESISRPDITNTSLFIYSAYIVDEIDPVLINITYSSTFIDNSNRTDQVSSINNNRTLTRFDQSVLFGVNASFSHGLDLSGNGFDDIPVLDLVDIRDLVLERNFIRELVSSEFLPTLIEVCFCSFV